MAFSSAFKVLSTLSSIIAVVTASGGTQDLCFGFSNGNGYNVNVLIEGLQSQSLSTICGHFDTTLHNNYAWCSPGQVNCQTNDDGSLVSIGVSTSDRDSGFSCVEAAFIETLQASVIPGIGGISCQDLDQGTGVKVRQSAKFKRSLAPRAIDNPSGIAGVGDTITLSSGRTLRLIGLGFVAPVAGAVIPTLVGGYFTDLVPTMSGFMGTTGVNAHPITSTLSPWTLITTFDAGINGGPGSIDSNDWQNLIGSLSHRMASDAAEVGLMAFFADVDTNEVLLSVGLLVNQFA